MPCCTLYLRAISQHKPPGGAYIWRGDLTEGFLRYEFRGLIFGGAYTRRGLFSEFYGICYGLRAGTKVIQYTVNIDDVFDFVNNYVGCWPVLCDVL